MKGYVNEKQYQHYLNHEPFYATEVPNEEESIEITFYLDKVKDYTFNHFKKEYYVIPKPKRFQFLSLRTKMFINRKFAIFVLITAMIAATIFVTLNDIKKKEEHRILNQGERKVTAEQYEAAFYQIFREYNDVISNRNLINNKEVANLAWTKVGKLESDLASLIPPKHLTELHLQALKVLEAGSTSFFYLGFYFMYDEESHLENADSWMSDQAKYSRKLFKMIKKQGWVD